jgi:hypothetical protein
MSSTTVITWCLAELLHEPFAVFAKRRQRPGADVVRARDVLDGGYRSLEGVRISFGQPPHAIHEQIRLQA